MCVCKYVCAFIYYKTKYTLIILYIIDNLRVGNYIFVFDSVCDNSYLIVVNS